jgi:hypothetical protein
MPVFTGVKPVKRGPKIGQGELADLDGLSLCWEDTAWRERVLENLQDAGVEVPRLSVHVMRIHHLRHLTDELFAEIGVVAVSDDD